jgi:hypothetical protein
LRKLRPARDRLDDPLRLGRRDLSALSMTLSAVVLWHEATMVGDNFLGCGNPIDMQTPESKAFLSVDYDFSWLLTFATLAAPISEVLRSIAVQVEHVGSLSAPGLARVRAS